MSPKEPHQDLRQEIHEAVKALMHLRGGRAIATQEDVDAGFAKLDALLDRAGTRSETTPPLQPLEEGAVTDVVLDAALEHDSRWPNADGAPSLSEFIAKAIMARFGTSPESERNARIVAALYRERDLLKLCRDGADCEICGHRRTVLDRILSAGEPAPSEEQRDDGVCRCEGPCTCNGSPEMLASGRAAETPVVQGTGQQSEPPPAASLHPEIAIALADELDVLTKHVLGEDVVCQSAALLRISLGNVVRRAGVEPESIMAHDKGCGSTVQVRIQEKGPATWPFPCDCTRDARIRAALSVTPRDQGGTTR